jgi:CheY-like chemotaxis protein
VVTDLSMPEMSGLDLARELRAMRPRLPILLLTGWIELSSDADFNTELVSGVLQKPVTTVKLLQQVSGLLAPPPDGRAPANGADHAVPA